MSTENIVKHFTPGSNYEKKKEFAERLSSCLDNSGCDWLEELQSHCNPWPADCVERMADELETLREQLEKSRDLFERLSRQYSSKIDAANKRANDAEAKWLEYNGNRCPECNHELSCCGEMTADGPSMDCEACQLKSQLTDANKEIASLKQQLVWAEFDTHEESEGER